MRIHDQSEARSTSSLAIALRLAAGGSVSVVLPSNEVYSTNDPYYTSGFKLVDTSHSGDRVGDRSLLKYASQKQVEQMMNNSTTILTKLRASGITTNSGVVYSKSIGVGYVFTTEGPGIIKILTYLPPGHNTYKDSDLYIELK